ncbi:hypothetical protein PHYBOEH_009637 [Phytophthora boehmeriae]|uniref:Uncharacterized protein n=1 Tax=Phytophthora boehmeriae TaxID=109152 RepID=A0A8T1VW37_9STRA|nr:hypothetical protein PHYBOEH_009636 [Phytophthora boehmeriae]KAG7384163.1 hypothetical protein PHYBOEH_009637 [Phytophthora boehmeriae]
MGSYLSIKNNTEDTWTCTIGPDEAALKIAGTVVTVVAAAATVIGTAGAATPVVSAATATGGMTVFGITKEALQAGASLASDYITKAGAVSQFGVSIAQGVNDNLASQGYVNIKPGESHQWGKMSLSLWQQGTCVRTTIKDETHVVTDTLYMRPIFSGATDNSNIDHEIQYWIDKFGLESSEITGTSDQQSRKHRKGAEDDDDSDDLDDETIYFYSNGTVGYGGEQTVSAHKLKMH